MSNAERVAVVGAGAWGTTIACMLSRSGLPTTLVAHTRDRIVDMERDRENRRYLPGVALPDGIRLSADVASAVAGASVVFLAVPSQQMRAASRNFAGTLRPGAVVVSCAKGFELESWLRMTEVIVDAGALAPERVCALSGPNLAREIAEGMPASAVVASVSAETAERVQRCVSSARFRVYTSDDPVGVEYGGALKNVIAIGAGAIDGMGLGQNAKAAFMTRGLAEITRLGVAAGANPLTFGGLSGLGDLIATCESPLSRNRTFGEQIGRGHSAADARDQTQHVVEGLTTSRVAVALGEQFNVPTPIASVVIDVVDGRMDIGTAIDALMRRDPRPERDDLANG